MKSTVATVVVDKNSTKESRILLEGKHRGFYSLDTEEDGDDIYLEDVVLFEKQKCDYFTIFNNEKTNLFINEVPVKKDENNELMTFIARNYGVEIKKLFEEIGSNVSAHLFGYFRKESSPIFGDRIRIEFFDMKINDCYVQWDDFKYFTGKYKLETVKEYDSILFKGIKDVLPYFEKYKGVDTFVVRPVFNRFKYGEKTQEINSYYIESPLLKNKTKELEKSAGEKARDIVNKVIGKNFLDRFSKAVLASGFSFSNKENISKILSLATNMVVSDSSFTKLYSDFINSTDERVEAKNFFIKEVRRFAPQTIKKLYWP
jgi:hypothetical protein